MIIGLVGVLSVLFKKKVFPVFPEAEGRVIVKVPPEPEAKTASLFASNVMLAVTEVTPIFVGVGATDFHKSPVVWLGSTVKS
jgi:hypothetical protein